ncbi:MAG TPA: sigma-70 family RNA polymerase sigma factor [Actinocrinis sp.]|jgi:RNA polymerase sigma factor (sigma-70 family)|uniref:RNA polymerase sigma factor n=1 Tax=Actinocrinis sp. TaxID=1920516 RepID=UPI002DDD7A1C|nr:sigma-70 family RNA polymerase sigma factor [Actinocrinis sp.]HEV3170913.1 sigma-70 family RNA polymerase sigma factor [Actinocrinis sp.]
MTMIDPPVLDPAVPESTGPDPAAPDSAAPDSVAAPQPVRRPDADRHERLAALLLAAQAGRREGLEQIVVELSPLLWQVARAQGLDREAAEDAVQCTWLTLLGNLDRIHTPVALTAWLVTATKREAWRVRAALKAELPVDGSAMTEMTDTANSLPAPEESVLLAERHRDVWRAVRTLPRRCQELLRVVAFVNRPDYDEIAVALGMPRGSIGPTRGRCLAKLRTLLDTEPHRSTA